MATLNTRIQLKFDTYQNWLDNDIVLLKGEIGIAEIPAETGHLRPCRPCGQSEGSPFQCRLRMHRTL